MSLRLMVYSHNVRRFQMAKKDPYTIHTRSRSFTCYRGISVNRPSVSLAIRRAVVVSVCLSVHTYCIYYYLQTNERTSERTNEDFKCQQRFQRQVSYIDTVWSILMMSRQLATALRAHDPIQSIPSTRSDHCWAPAAGWLRQHTNNTLWLFGLWVL